MTARLTEFRIEKLFGLYSHQINLRLEERITIIIGPNGRGKTVCLKFIEALFQKRTSYFLDIPFDFATFTFEGGEVIRVEVVESTASAAADGPSGRSVRFTMSHPDREDIVWTPAIMDRTVSRELRRLIPESWRQVAFDLWIDDTDGEEVTTSELVRRHRIPPKIVALLREEMPKEFLNLIGEIDCHLIETQRLLVLPVDTEVERHALYYDPARRRARVSRLAIQQKAEKLKAILGETLARYANLSQSLDRTFPLRVFEAQGSAKLSEDNLRQELRSLDERRAGLMASGILDTDYQPVSLLAGNIDPGVVKALEIYVSDTVNKLDVFNDIRSRIDLFKDLIGKRFIDKTLQIERENGFKITSANQSDVPLDKLSSGEQHQLILIFDLIFEVSKNSLILIDEPELSLHVAWQKTFIESLSRIISLNAFDVLLATHSPAIVARHFDLTVELAPVDE
jgi:predicted ATP-binding protein involved in virulence